MLCLLDMAGVVWVVCWFVLYSWITLSAIFCALFIILKLIDYIRKELDL
jgi:ABC-type microcin C transport system permease subunit YejE